MYSAFLKLNLINSTPIYLPQYPIPSKILITPSTLLNIRKKCS